MASAILDGRVTLARLLNLAPTGNYVKPKEKQSFDDSGQGSSTSTVGQLLDDHRKIE